jgi:hypothetical protein
MGIASRNHYRLKRQAYVFIYYVKNIGEYMFSRSLCICLFCCSAVHANIYKCVTEDGQTYYQSIFCNDETDLQTELNCYTRPLNKKAAQQVQRALQKQRKDLLKSFKKKQRKTQQLAKQELAAEKRHQHTKVKCEKIKREIDEITQLYRSGYNIKQGITLSRKLSDCQEQKKRYCIHE